MSRRGRARIDFVLLRAAEYARLAEEDEGYDASPWTRGELETVAWGTGEMAGWDEMDIYDNLPEKL